MIRKAVARDREAVVATLTAAFARDPIIRFQFQDDQTYDQRAAAFFGHYFDVRLTGGEIFVADDLAGAALWSPPEGNRLGRDAVEQHWRRTVIPSITADELARYTSFKEVLDSMTPAEPHWYLGLLGTRPERQRTGVARALLEPILGRAAREGIPVFLETGAPENVAFYERFGFGVKAQASVPNGPLVWGLIRR